LVFVTTLVRKPRCETSIQLYIKFLKIIPDPTATTSKACFGSKNPFNYNYVTPLYIILKILTAFKYSDVYF